MLGVLGAILGGTKSGLAIGFPAGQNLVEGTEASLMVGGSAARAGWRRAWIAVLAALVALMPFLAGLWFAYRYVPGEYIDYAIAVLIFAIGVRELREGLGSRPKQGRGRRRFALEGPLGIDPADPAAIRRFQRQHGLAEDGVLGPLTRGAIVAALAERGERARPTRLGIDVTDEESVRAFQRRLGLHEDGVVGPQTQGALAAESALRLLDPADAESVRRFQRDHALPVTGVVDPPTQAALAAVRAEREAWEEGESRSPYGFDLTDADAIDRFQRGRGLEPTGVVDRRTQGALRAEVERRLVRLLDPADAVSVRRFQLEHGLEPTGFVDEATRQALAFEREAVRPTTAEQRTVLGVDPTDPASVERFQALHGLDRSGEIDEETLEELRRVEEWTGGLDPTDPESVARFQRGHGLEQTGVVDAPTQGALQSRRRELEQRHGVDDEDANPDGEGRDWYPLDPARPESVERFQRRRGLRPDGRIGTRTAAAVRATLAERTRDRVTRQQGGNGIAAIFGPAWMAFVGTLLEGGEAGLFTIAIGHSTGAWTTAAIAGGSGFVLPWIVLVAIRDWIESRPEWAFELTIGIVLTSVATLFGLFRAVGLFGA